ncbi:hypothetical protein [Sphingobium sp. B11D3D]|uniref:hypothetical protein n=1 Tax=Sphingobium sp. B11D3D TaxID=2940576 RepID=UPI002224EE1F|nr:hypothetical protein [Sphingobium sp. B11D3D]MCW2370063.1 CheY-like chemotaxis protein [Sphingobium sp. B11D3D]
MKILIVEDDSFKLEAILFLVNRVAEMAEVKTAMSLRSAMTALEEGIFDLVVLDMAIPSHTSDVGAIDTYSQPVGGLDVLLFLATMERAERIAVLTQYPTIEYNRSHVPLREFMSVLHQDSVTNVDAVILFSDDGTWRDTLTGLLRVLM